MKVFNLVTVALLGLAGSAVATTGKKCSKRTHHGNKHCLKDSDVEELSAAYARLVGEFTVEDGERYLADDWTDVSQSINTFVGKPQAPDTVTFTKDAFMAAQQRQPGNPVNVLSVPVVDCKSFALIWTSTFGAQDEPRPVRGITIVETEKVHHNKWVMTKWDVEFNSLSWNYNMGGSYCLPVPPSPIIVGDATCGA